MSREAPTQTGVEIIRAMSRDDFHKKIVRKIGNSSAFGAAVSLGAEHISAEERFIVRKALDEAGIPISLTESNSDLDDVIAVITARAVTVR